MDLDEFSRKASLSIRTLEEEKTIAEDGDATSDYTATKPPKTNDCQLGPGSL